MATSTSNKSPTPVAEGAAIRSFRIDAKGHNVPHQAPDEAADAALEVGGDVG